ncbi:MAG: hypothetical protein H6733_06640 [Alphaproteobacteria bacterium]|nr:hypothetical protein [Alphaproteobacteria bacterium]
MSRSTSNAIARAALFASAFGCRGIDGSAVDAVPAASGWDGPSVAHAYDPIAVDTDPADTPPGPEPLDAVALATRRPPLVHVDYQNGCALEEEGKAFCWGNREYVFRDMDQGPFDVICNKALSPMAIRRGEPGLFFPVADSYTLGGFEMAAEPYSWVDLDCGVTDGSGACGIDTDGALHCYRANAGDIPTGSGWVKVSIGYRTVCALHSTDGVQCWGSSERLGDFSYSVPPAVDVDVGPGGACVITPERTVVCDGSEPGIVDGVPPNLDEVWRLAVGHVFACALKLSGEVVCWGGTSAAPNSEVIDEAPVTHDFVALDVNFAHACAIRSNGTVECWGVEDRGVLDPPTPP